MQEKRFVLIVGASSGIGAEMASALSNDETTVILMARRLKELKETQRKLKGESIIAVCDVCDYEQIADFFESLITRNIKLSAMIYTAGICCIKPIKAMDPGELDAMFAVNVFGFYEMCRHFQTPKVSVKGATITAISSYASVLEESGMSAYAMTKSALNTAVKIMAKEFAKREIRVNAILPANVMSKMSSDDNTWNDEELQEIKARQRYGVIPIEEVVSTILFIMSERATHMTGELITISAGYCC